MNFEEKEKIRNNYVLLTGNIRLPPNDLLDHLYESGIILEDDIERISSEKTTLDRAHRLLNILFTKPGCLDIFCDSLDKTDNGFLAKAIKETNIDPCEIVTGIVHLKCIIPLYNDTKSR